ncbi:PREDICTED: uncharacterized protein LOC106105810 [Papilio polytes]|uniref:uncharacterized protein LOC106105810 n=1 Tax=Papilio polytes TaxID=76194 RepID=UPI0006767302|nr:PREDICTED: uncharacterized protein LOC106105810 [Papilio polytes]
MELYECAPPPMRLTIDCSSDEESFFPMVSSSSAENFDSSHFDVDSFCAMIQRAIPKAVENGRFLPTPQDYDMTGYADSQAPVAITPPKGFIPNFGLNKLKISKLGIPKINVPKLKPITHKLGSAPSIGTPMKFKSLKVKIQEESSAERMEKFKKGVHKLLHVVKVLGQIDQYLSDRTRIVVDKLSKTFGD